MRITIHASRATRNEAFDSILRAWRALQPSQPQLNLSHSGGRGRGMGSLPDSPGPMIIMRGAMLMAISSWNMSLHAYGISICEIC